MVSTFHLFSAGPKHPIPHRDTFDELDQTTSSKTIQPFQSENVLFHFVIFYRMVMSIRKAYIFFKPNTAKEDIKKCT
jgi:hypothetical protein